MDFDPAASPTKSTIVRYFEEDLKPFIKGKIDQDVTHLNNYEKLVAKRVKAETKAGLQPSFHIQESDQ